MTGNDDGLDGEIDGPVEYELTWRNKYRTTGAKNLDEMIDALRLAVDELRAMKVAGVVLADTVPVQDDSAILTTTDPAVAERFGFEQVECLDGDELEEDDEESEDEEYEDDEFEEDGEVVEGSGRVAEVQRLATRRIAGRRYERVRHGQEGIDPCYACGVVEGQFHTPGCKCECCPRCGGQAISCDCPWGG
jgi:hypothetical protein